MHGCQQMPLAIILSVSWSPVSCVRRSNASNHLSPLPPSSCQQQQQSKLPNQFSPVIKSAHRKLHSTRSNPMASSDVVRPSNLIQQTPYIHHPSILYGNPPGIASGQFVNPVSVALAVVAWSLQTQLHGVSGNTSWERSELLKQHRVARWV